MSNQKELKGLGGWLILVGLGVVLTPFIIIFDSMEIIKLLQDDALSVFTTPNTEYYKPYFVYLIWGELFVNVVFLILAITAVYFFFTKHYRFPKFYIGLLIGYAVVIFLDALILNMVMPEIPIFDEETNKELGKAVIRCLIWGPYLLISVRVKNTFVENKPRTGTT